MRPRANRAILTAAALLALLADEPAWADVKAGVDAWSRGDHADAVREWQGPAAAGDPDAMFNLAQAYRLGRGVPKDLAEAEALYARAAATGHLEAADSYGLLLFQDGRREAALPYIMDAARRGDARSEYLLGIAYFNGDMVPKDWVRAYMLLTLANSQGLPQAAPALAQMDQQIPLAQRQQADELAVQLQRQAGSARGRNLAAADRVSGEPSGSAGSGPMNIAQLPGSVITAPRAPATIATSPPTTAARTVIADADRAATIENPAEANASYLRARAPVAPQPQVARAYAAPEKSQDPRETASGPWRVQLGAFAVPGNAERLWSRLAGRSELSGKTRLMVPTGKLTKLQAGGYPSRAAAEAACRSLKDAGQECLVTR